MEDIIKLEEGKLLWVEGNGRVRGEGIRVGFGNRSGVWDNRKEGVMKVV